MKLADPLGGIKMAKGHLVLHISLFLVSIIAIPYTKTAELDNQLAI